MCATVRIAASPSALKWARGWSLGEGLGRGVDLCRVGASWAGLLGWGHVSLIAQSYCVRTVSDCCGAWESINCRRSEEAKCEEFTM